MLNGGPSRNFISSHDSRNEYCFLLVGDWSVLAVVDGCYIYIFLDNRKTIPPLPSQRTSYGNCSSLFLAHIVEEIEVNYVEWRAAIKFYLVA